MSDSDEKTTDQTLRVNAPGKLSLNKSLESSRIKQSFSHGRTKTVTVEVRKTRTVQRDESGKIVEVSRANATAHKIREDAAIAQSQAAANVVSDIVDSGDKKEARILTEEERQLRRKVLERAQVNKEHEDKQREDERRSSEASRKRFSEQRTEAAVPAPEDLPVLTEIELAESRKEKDKDKAKKKPIDIVFDEEASSGRKKGSSKKRRRHDDGFGEDINLEDLDLYKPVEPTEEIIPPALQVIFDESDEFEDYTQDEPSQKEDDSIVAVTQKVEDNRLKTVRLINSSERVIMAAVDPNKIKKYLRSEAPVMAPRRRNEPVKTPEPVVTERKTGIKKRGKHFKRPVSSAEIIVREVVIPETIVVSELANRMAVRVVDVIKSLMKMGMMVTQNQSIDADTAELIVNELGHTPIRVSDSDVENVLAVESSDSEADLKPRAPVVTVMGHVDHGKTSLLDAIRATNVVSGESGGITQHIGAYKVTTPDGHHVTFIDTPGHEAFTAMRARGAKVTDIVVLVVAADDGIKQQTVEAINHAKAAGVPIIVAVNKVDKPGADPSRVRNELMAHELVTEEFGGDVIAVDVSAKQKLNIDKLLSSILVQAEIMELKANPDAPASGTVVESRIDKGRGAVATVLVQRGTLRVGDIIVAGSSFGYARALMNEHGQMLKEAGPATPVEVLGLDNVPNAGDSFAVAPSERDAREITEFRANKEKEQKSAGDRRLSLDDLFTDGKAKIKELPVIVKGDVHGSVEAIAGSLEKIDSNEVKARVIHSGVGAITESDVVLARASNAIILGFNVRANTHAKEMASREKIDIRYYSIIYDLVDDVKKALSGMLAPEFKENFLGYAEIRQVFNITKVGKVAGSMVTQGIIKRSARARLLRDNVVIHEGALKTLRRFKEDVKEVKEGFECGIAFENYEDIRERDTVEVFEMEQVTRSI